jgi:LuxR family maltose regulon positive regulatory protein
MSDRGIVGVPRVPEGMLERAGLRDRLGRSPLTVVRAPGGSGKTVLMAQWASRHAGAGAWVTVEPDVGSRLAFWTSVIASLAHLGRTIPMPSDDGGADGDVLRGALLRAFRALDDPVVLVIDDAHELRDPLVADDLLAVLRASRHVTAIVGTRTRSALEAPREALTLDVSVIEPEELVLSVHEIERIVGAHGSRYGTAAELLEASGGSPLLLRAILAGSSPGAGGDGSARGVIADYLAGLFRARDDLELFASTSSVPDDVDLESAQHLSGLPLERVTALLDSLEADGLVMRHEAPGGARFRYHPLVREVLRDELRRHRPEQFRRASLVASADAEARRQFIPALRHAVEAEDYIRASDVCLHGGFALLRSRGAAPILQQVPLRYVARLPFLAVMLGLAANGRGERLRALEYLTLALGASRAWRRTQRVAEQAGLALIETVVLRITGRAVDAVAPARRMMAILESAPPGELDEIADQLGSYWYQGALSLFRAGELSAARVAAERVGISAEALAGDASETFAAASLVATIDAVRGDCRSAAELLARIDAIDLPIDLRDGYVGTLAYLARGILTLEAGDAASVTEQLDAFGARPNLEHGMLFAALRGVLGLWDGDPELGLRTLEQREANDSPRARVTAEDRIVAAAVRVLLHAALGQTGPAQASLRMLDRRDPLAAVLHATLLVLEGRPEQAIERLTGQRDWHGPRLQAASEVLTASAALMREDADVASAAMRRFLATHAVHGTLTPLVLVPAELRPALAELAEGAGADAAVLASIRGLPAPLRTGGARAALTQRESDVLQQLRFTASAAEIATALGVSTNTVKSQQRTLYRKLGVSTRDDALRAAYLQGLLLEG